VKKIIKNVLDEMEKRSSLEKTKKLDISLEDRMLAITMETGKFFNIMLRIMNAKNILEVGTSTGYSTLWCAEAIQENFGKIITIEKNPDKIIRARKNFEKAGVSEMVEIREGMAEEVLLELNNEGLQNHFDFVLIDSDKEGSIRYFDLILPLLRKNGMIATDNILYPKKYRPEMQKFQNHIKNNPKVISVTVPIGNGEEITLKIKN
jgi:predicted O-methyltransferase YrrM